ncbi:hypothetical protein J6590_101054 [Homalodisca vitripennis]|nr:hypothetical protein J6590_101054 [Homalodisca vitripennis]
MFKLRRRFSLISSDEHDSRFQESSLGQRQIQDAEIKIKHCKTLRGAAPICKRLAENKYDNQIFSLQPAYSPALGLFTLQRLAVARTSCRPISVLLKLHKDLNRERLWACSAPLEDCGHKKIGKVGKLIVAAANFTAAQLTHLSHSALTIPSSASPCFCVFPLHNLESCSSKEMQRKSVMKKLKMKLSHRFDIRESYK